ncbi:MAG: hypothetical protein ACRDZU_16715 [Acidimicrobiales bacterium]
METAVNTATVIDRFIEGIRTGHVTPDLYAKRARLDATVPGWRFQARGPAKIAAEYRSWYAGPSQIDTLERHPIEDGEVVRYFMRFDVGGQAHAAHHVHVLKVRDELILSDTVFCGGRWGPEVLAEMGPAAHAG